MPAILITAISRTTRAGALALAGLGLIVATMSAVPAPAHASPGHQASASSHAMAKKQHTRRAAPARRIHSRAVTAKNIAMRQRGSRYSYGAAGPGRFDCSGLIYYSYRRAGFKVPRSSSGQAGHARRIAKKRMRPGDLMFFSGRGGVYHSAVFLRWSRGHAVMLHSPRSGQRVKVAAPWTTRWYGGTLRR